jgi:glycosyltransferase involved in cell wall biosynthesis
MVDDGSEGKSVAVAKQEIARCKFASAEVIELKHEGIVPTLNTGLKAVKTEFVVRIDGDATVETPDWISILINMLRHSEVGVAGGQVIWENGRVHSFGRSVFTEQGLYDMGCCPLEPVGQRTFDSIVHRPLRQFQGGLPYEVDSILGVCVAFRRSEAQTIGGFDMRFNPVWIEDDDFGLSIRKLGKRIIVNPKIKIVHRPSLRGSRQPTESLARKDVSLHEIVKRGMETIHKLAHKPAAHFRRKSARRSIEAFIPSEGGLWRRNILLTHYATWKNKWGVDPINPEMSDVFERYWDTSFCRHANPSQLIKSGEFLRRLIANNYAR